MRTLFVALIVLVATLAQAQEMDRPTLEQLAAEMEEQATRLRALRLIDDRPMDERASVPEGQAVEPIPQESYLDPARLYLRRVGPDVVVAADLLEGSPGEILRNTGKYIVQSPASFLTSAAVAYVAVRGVQGKLDEDFDRIRGKKRKESGQSGGTASTRADADGNVIVVDVSGDNNTINIGEGNSRDTTTTTNPAPAPAPEPVVAE